jgi:hypothetical protein
MHDLELQQQELQLLVATAGAAATQHPSVSTCDVPFRTPLCVPPPSVFTMTFCWRAFLPLPPPPPGPVQVV